MSADMAIRSRGNPVTLTGGALWQRRFGASRDAIGKMLEVDGQAFQVMEVMPAGFYFPTKDVQLWQPATLVS